MALQRKTPAAEPGLGMQAGERAFRGPDTTTYGDPVETFKAAHGGRFTKSGSGWRADCRCCDDHKAALSVTESGGWLLAHCFKCGADRAAILASVGLRLVDVGPPRHWPVSGEERRAWSRAQREAGLRSALSVLATEAAVARIAAAQTLRGEPLELDDWQRLAVACERIDGAAAVLVEATAWRPGVKS